MANDRVFFNGPLVQRGVQTAEVEFGVCLCKLEAEDGVLDMTFPSGEDGLFFFCRGVSNVRQGTE